MNSEPCEMDCPFLGEWDDWSGCSIECIIAGEFDEGSQIRHRPCTYENGTDLLEADGTYMYDDIRYTAACPFNESYQTQVCENIPSCSFNFTDDDGEEANETLLYVEFKVRFNNCKISSNHVIS